MVFDEGWLIIRSIGGHQYVAFVVTSGTERRHHCGPQLAGVCNVASAYVLPVLVQGSKLHAGCAPQIVSTEVWLRAYPHERRVALPAFPTVLAVFDKIAPFGSWRRSPLTGHV